MSNDQRERTLITLYCFLPADSLGSLASSDEERKEIVNTDTWKKKPDVIITYECQEVKESGHTYPR